MGGTEANHVRILLEWEKLVNLVNKMPFANFYLPITSVLAIHGAC